ncbi:hypothetical protein SPRG_00554 [Saprolegnia parasitica CBS 223.65]|uniref:COG complex component COG2 C-terminal domain-containing protein n=1 Tax=Saprolegnia parasitica (strain CBS 223.65) TaxID=695850 RepID=A0A067D726_SAPPC|nr:hypothetical protein SPRG_00554 [Saprolegnia parasitica CBS 223.65]KDO34491.1 hypothetical protein SPRG_00554 [Saprolegnia parasitica CBS 223.65]|eukprot:XP_012194170.1 hypothetical protein SPRG_00554 [Saprolegnia parasitica CBS 223.65]
MAAPSSPSSNGTDPPLLPSMPTFASLPVPTYVRCLHLHAAFRKAFAAPPIQLLQDAAATERLGASLQELITCGRADEAQSPSSSAMILLPSIRLFLQIVLAQDLATFAKAPTVSTDMLLSVGSFQRVLLHTTQSIDAVLSVLSAYLESISYAPAFTGTLVTPIEELQAQLKLHLALWTEEWTALITRAAKHICDRQGIPSIPTAADRMALRTSPYAQELLHVVLQPLSTFLLSEPNVASRSYLLHLVSRHTFEAWIEELASITKVSEAGSVQLRKDVETVKLWCGDIDSRHRDVHGYSRLQNTSTLQRLDRTVAAWRQTEMRKRRSSFDMVMDSSLITTSRHLVDRMTLSK